MHDHTRLCIRPLDRTTPFCAASEMLSAALHSAMHQVSLIAAAASRRVSKTSAPASRRQHCMRDWLRRCCASMYAFCRLLQCTSVCSIEAPRAVSLLQCPARCPCISPELPLFKAPHSHTLELTAHAMSGHLVIVMQPACIVMLLVQVGASWPAFPSSCLCHTPGGPDLGCPFLRG